MKKSLIVLFLGGFSLLQGFSDSYKQVREEFKLALYRHQALLMGRKQYNAFIEPYLQEAEKTLKAPRYCMENSTSPLCKKYFECLIKCNVACFYCFLDLSVATKAMLAAATQNLSVVIKQINETGLLEEFDVQEELQKTGALLYKANQAYREELPKPK